MIYCNGRLHYHVHRVQNHLVEEQHIGKDLQLFIQSMESKLRLLHPHLNITNATTSYQGSKRLNTYQYVDHEIQGSLLISKLVTLEELIPTYLSVEFLKEGQNSEFGPSLREFSIKNPLVCLVPDPNLKWPGLKLLEPPLSLQKLLELENYDLEFQDFKQDPLIGFSLDF